MRHFIWVLFAISAIVIYSCTITVKHKIEGDININIGIDEECLVCQASCDVDGNILCESPAGDIDCSNCAAGCIGAGGAMCMEDGALFCYATVSNIELQVPSICVQRDFDTTVE